MCGCEAACQECAKTKDCQGSAKTGAERSGPERSGPGRTGPDRSGVEH